MNIWNHKLSSVSFILSTTEKEKSATSCATWLAAVSVSHQWFIRMNGSIIRSVGLSYMANSWQSQWYLWNMKAYLPVAALWFWAKHEGTGEFSFLFCSFAARSRELNVGRFIHSGVCVSGAAHHCDISSRRVPATLSLWPAFHIGRRQRRRSARLRFNFCECDTRLLVEQKEDRVERKLEHLLSSFVVTNTWSFSNPIRVVCVP